MGASERGETSMSEPQQANECQNTTSGPLQKDTTFMGETEQSKLLNHKQTVDCFCIAHGSRELVSKKVFFCPQCVPNASESHGMSRTDAPSDNGIDPADAHAFEGPLDSAEPRSQTQETQECDTLHNDGSNVSQPSAIFSSAHPHANAHNGHADAPPMDVVRTGPRIEDYTLEYVIGAGEASTVYCARLRSAANNDTLPTGDGPRGKETSTAHVALKLIVKARLHADAIMYDADAGLALPTEIFVLRHLREAPHPCILRAAGEAFENEQYYALPLPLHTGPDGRPSDLFALLQSAAVRASAEGALLAPRVVAGIFAQVVSALAHMHNALGCVHGDIKDENVMVCVRCARDEGRAPHVLLADFGSARYVRTDVPPTLGAHRRAQWRRPSSGSLRAPPVAVAGTAYGDRAGPGVFVAYRGTRDFIPPEVLRREPYAGPPQDIWALGVVLHLLLYGCLPHAGPHDAATGVRAEVSLPRGETVGEDALLAAMACAAEAMLARSVGERPRACDLAALPWVVAAWDDVASDCGRCMNSAP